MTRLITEVSEWQKERKLLAGKSLGLVHTMGNLHVGHASLLERSLAENDFTALIIFTNPTQFNDPADFARYPRTLDEDFALAEKYRVDYVFAPKPEDIYADQFRFQVSENKDSEILEGAQRPGHFTGVLTVVMKMFTLFLPTRSYWGEKDKQQLELVKSMVDAFFLPIEIVKCETYRDTDGLPMSSRNRFLSQSERIQAAQFSKILQKNLSNDEIKTELESAGFIVDYIENYKGRRLGAVRLGSVRLLDNVILS